MAEPEHRILAIDQGTTGTAAMVFDEKLRIMGEGDREFTQHFPKPGWVEHDALEIWDTTRTVIQQALKKSRSTPHQIDAIGITNQRETVVAWDADSLDPLAPALVWQDRRTAARCQRLQDDDQATWIRERTGLVADPYFSATKMEWLLANDTAVQRAAKSGKLRFGTIDSWLIARLSAGAAHITDASNASRTMLYDLDSHTYNDELLQLFGVPQTALPTIVPSAGHNAETSAAVFGARVPISGIAGDQQAALFGQACYQPGEAKNTYGTGSFLLMNTGTKRPSSDRLLSTVAWQIDNTVEYALEGSIFTTGASVQWLRDGLGLINRASTTERLAKKVDDTHGVRFLPALAGLAAPHWDPHARGMFVGLTRGTKKEHLIRAVLEATAYRSAEVLEAMEADAGVAIKTLRCDGGGTANKFLMQFQADLLGVAVEVPKISETTALGAASLAALGADIFPNRDAVAAAWKRDKRYMPRMTAGDRDKNRAQWHRFIEAAREFYGAMDE